MTWSKFDNYLLLLVHDSMLRHYMLSEIRLSVCLFVRLSVRHTGGSVENKPVGDMVRSLV